ncbi:MAG: hypothetical protein MHM6MM_007235, partial [Cercozoa sp. M6MM]
MPMVSPVSTLVNLFNKARGRRAPMTRRRKPAEDSETASMLLQSRANEFCHVPNSRRRSECTKNHHVDETSEVWWDSHYASTRPKKSKRHLLQKQVDELISTVQNLRRRIDELSSNLKQAGQQLTDMQLRDQEQKRLLSDLRSQIKELHLTHNRPSGHFGVRQLPVTASSKSMPPSPHATNIDRKSPSHVTAGGVRTQNRESSVLAVASGKSNTTLTSHLQAELNSSVRSQGHSISSKNLKKFDDVRIIRDNCNCTFFFDVSPLGEGSLRQKDFEVQLQSVVSASEELIDEMENDDTCIAMFCVSQ